LIYSLELEAVGPGSFSQSGNAAMKLVTSAIKANCFDFFGFGKFGDLCSDGFGNVCLGAFYVSCPVVGASQSSAGCVVNDLYVNVAQCPMDAKAWNALVSCQTGAGAVSSAKKIVVGG
jgi:hypothetical protein